MIKTEMPQEQIEQLGVWQAATKDGYWEDAASKDIQRVYLLGQLKATQSMHLTDSCHSTRLRIKWLKEKLAQL